MCNTVPPIQRCAGSAGLHRTRTKHTGASAVLRSLPMTSCDAPEGPCQPPTVTLLLSRRHTHLCASVLYMAVQRDAIHLAALRV
jgi:hypothetical protein